MSCRTASPRLPHRPIALVLAGLLALASTGTAQVLNKQLTIFNDGNAPLSVTGIAKEGNAPWVTVTPPSAFPVQIGAGASATFDVAVNTSGLTTAVNERLIVSSNDPDENPYPTGVFVNYTPSGEMITKQFTVFNDGNGMLSVTGITKVQNAPWITVTPPSAFPVQIGPGGSATFNVTVNTAGLPAGANDRLLVASNDPDENPYPTGVFIGYNPNDPTPAEVANFLLGLAPEPSGADANNNARIEIGDVVTLVNEQ